MIYKIFLWAVLTNSSVCGKMVFVFRFFASLGGVGAFFGFERADGWCESVARRSEGSPSYFGKNGGFVFGSSRVNRLLESDVLRRVK